MLSDKSTFREPEREMPPLNFSLMGEEEKRIDAKPLFDRLDASKGEAARFAKKMGLSHGRVANWRNRGIPAAMLPDVAAYLAMSTDAYLEAAGRPRPAVFQQPPGQYTLEGQKFLDDYYALPEGLREHVAKKTAELRAYADALPAFIRNGLRPPTDPETYRAWEKDMEVDMRRRLLEAPPPPPGPRPKPPAKKKR